MRAETMNYEDITLEQRIFRNKATLLLVVIACALEVFFSGRSIGQTPPFMRDWVLVLGLLFCVWMFAALAFRTKGIKERFLFGSIAVAFISWTVIAVMLPSLQTVFLLKGLICLMWISATVTGIAMFL